MRIILAAHGLTLSAALRKRVDGATHLCLGRYAATLQDVTLTASPDPAAGCVRMEVRLVQHDGAALAISALAPTMEEALERSLARAARSLDARHAMEKMKSWMPKR